MQVLLYDGTFQGWLSAVFDIYEYKYKAATIAKADSFQKILFATEHLVNTTDSKARRVWAGLEQRLSKAALQQLYNSWLSELEEIDNTLLQYVQYAFSTKQPVENDFSCAAVLAVSQVARKVHREAHRMEAFVRFQLTKDGLYYAIVEPDFNVLPLISGHFEKRYADQRWMIFDAKRHYGIYYDLEKVSTVQVSFSEQTGRGKDISAVYDEQENVYQHLWQRYFASVNIAARKNTRLHIQHMPRRYWKYLPEKNDGR